MEEIFIRMVASVLIAGLLCCATIKMLGILQQGGYQNGVFWRWLCRKNNLQFNRLAVLALCLTLVSAITALCFSFVGERWATLISSIPFLGMLFVFLFSDRKYALKVSAKRTPRLVRLFVFYCALTAIAAYSLIFIFQHFAGKSDSIFYGLLQYAPVGILPIFSPFLLIAANFCIYGFEEARNRKFVKRAGQVLDETEIIRIGVVGSYGKTSVKNILNTLLSERYKVIATPASYNTPMGMAKTIVSEDFDRKQIFIAEMGARKKGDIAELCALVKPDYAIFTGICEQHIQSFGSIENIWQEKSEILRCGAKKVVCGEGIKPLVEQMNLGSEVMFGCAVSNVRLGAVATAFELVINGKPLLVKTKLLGKAAVENIRLAVALCVELGLTEKEIVRGIEKLESIPHRLQLIEKGGVYILDDGYNCNPMSAEEALEALKRFGGRKCLVTPGIVEGGILETKINAELGEKIAKANLDKVILVGTTLVDAVKNGYEAAGGDLDKCIGVHTLADTQGLLSAWLKRGDAVLFLNDLPDVY